jgi:hypothetical protein
MANSIADKLKIKPNHTLLTPHAPADFKKGLGALPPGVKITDTGKNYNQVHWFVLQKHNWKRK